MDRCIPGGSVGKNTSVLNPDFDVVVFLNKKQPPLLETVEDFKNLLKSEAKSFGIIPSSITWSSNTATAEFEQGIEMDILPACSFFQDPEKQRQEVHRQIRACPEKYLMYSSSLADTQTKFMKDQPGSTHQLIRLVKFWYKTLTLGEYVYGGSFLMEVLCATVCKEEQSLTKRDVPMLERFKAVLKKISEIYTLQIAFLPPELNNGGSKPNGSNGWKLLNGNEAKKYKTYFWSEILSRPRFIIDPSNPFNDLIKNLGEDVVHNLKIFASKMLVRIGKLESTGSNECKTVTSAMDVTLHIDKIFEPLSLGLKDSFKNEGIPKKVVIHYDYQSYKSSESKTVTNKDDSFLQNNKDAKKICKTILTNLVTLVRIRAKREGNRYIFKNGLPVIGNKADVKKAVEIFLKENFTSEQVNIGTSNNDHKGCDVTVYIPYLVDTTAFAVRFSMSWR